MTGSHPLSARTISVRFLMLAASAGLVWLGWRLLFWVRAERQGALVPAACLLIAGAAGILAQLHKLFREPLLARTGRAGLEWIDGFGKHSIPWGGALQVDFRDLRKTVDGRERWIRVVARDGKSVTLKTGLRDYDSLAEEVRQFATPHLRETRHVEHTGPTARGTVTTLVRENPFAS